MSIMKRNEASPARDPGKLGAAEPLICTGGGYFRNSDGGQRLVSKLQQDSLALASQPPPRVTDSSSLNKDSQPEVVTTNMVHTQNLAPSSKRTSQPGISTSGPEEEVRSPFVHGVKIHSNRMQMQNRQSINWSNTSQTHDSKQVQSEQWTNVSGRQTQQQFMPAFPQGQNLNEHSTTMTAAETKRIESNQKVTATALLSGSAAVTPPSAEGAAQAASPWPELINFNTSNHLNINRDLYLNAASPFHTPAPERQKYVYVSAIQKNIDNIIPKGCAKNPQAKKSAAIFSAQSTRKTSYLADSSEVSPIRKPPTTHCWRTGENSVKKSSLLKRGKSTMAGSSRKKPLASESKGLPALQIKQEPKETSKESASRENISTAKSELVSMLRIGDKMAKSLNKTIVDFSKANALYHRKRRRDKLLYNSLAKFGEPEPEGTQASEMGSRPSGPPTNSALRQGGSQMRVRDSRDRYSTSRMTSKQMLASSGKLSKPFGNTKKDQSPQKVVSRQSRQGRNQWVQPLAPNYFSQTRFGSTRPVLTPCNETILALQRFRGEDPSEQLKSGDGLGYSVNLENNLFAEGGPQSKSQLGEKTSWARGLKGQNVLKSSKMLAQASGQPGAQTQMHFHSSKLGLEGPSKISDLEARFADQPATPPNLDTALAHISFHSQTVKPGGLAKHRGRGANLDKTVDISLQNLEGHYDQALGALKPAKASPGIKVGSVLALPRTQQQSVLKSNKEMLMGSKQLNRISKLQSQLKQLQGQRSPVNLVVGPHHHDYQAISGSPKLNLRSRKGSRTQSRKSPSRQQSPPSWQSRQSRQSRQSQQSIRSRSRRASLKQRKKTVTSGAFELKEPDSKERIGRVLSEGQEPSAEPPFSPVLSNEDLQHPQANSAEKDLPSNQAEETGQGEQSAVSDVKPQSVMSSASKPTNIRLNVKSLAPRNSKPGGSRRTSKRASSVSPRRLRRLSKLTRKDPFEHMEFESSYQFGKNDGLALVTQRANDKGLLEQQTFRELHNGDHYLQMLELERLGRRDRRLSRSVLGPGPPGHLRTERGSRSRRKQSLRMKNRYPANIDRIDCQRKIVGLNKDIRQTRRDLFDTLKNPKDLNYHQEIEAQDTHEIPYKQRVDVVENVPLLCKIRCKGAYGLRVFCQVICEERVPFRRQFEELRHESPEIARDRSKEGLPPFRFQKTARDRYPSEGSKPVSHGDGTFLTSLVAEASQPPSPSPRTRRKSHKGSKKRNPSRPPSPGSSLLKRTMSFNISHRAEVPTAGRRKPPAHSKDLQIYVSTQPDNLDPSKDNCEMKVDGSRRRQFFFKISPPVQEGAKLESTTHLLTQKKPEAVFSQSYVYLQLFSYTGCSLFFKAQFTAQTTGKEAGKQDDGQFFEERSPKVKRDPKMDEKEKEELAHQYILELREYYHENTKHEKEEKKRKTNYVAKNIEETTSLLNLEKGRHLWKAKEKMYLMSVRSKARQLATERREQREAGLTHWDEYREIKFELVKRYVEVLKRQKRLREFVVFPQLLRIFQRFRDNLAQLRRMRRNQLRSVYYAIHFYCNFKLKFQKRYGPEMSFRNKNVIRRLTTFGALGMEEAQRARAREVIKMFLENINPRLKLTDTMIRLNMTIKRIEMQRLKVVMTRLYRKKYFMKLFEREHKFLLEYFLSSKKLKHGKAVYAALKKIDKNILNAAITEYQRKQLCEYMTQETQRKIKQLEARISLSIIISQERGQRLLEQQNRRAMRAMNKKSKSRQLTTHSNHSSQQDATPKPIKTEESQPSPRGSEASSSDASTVKGLSDEFMKRLYTDQIQLKKLQEKAREWMIEGAELEESLYQGFGTSIVYELKTHELSYKRYKKKIDDRAKHLMAKIKADMKTALASKLLKKKHLSSISDQRAPAKDLSKLQLTQPSQKDQITEGELRLPDSKASHQRSTRSPPGRKVPPKTVLSPVSASPVNSPAASERAKADQIPKTITGEASYLQTSFKDRLSTGSSPQKGVMLPEKQLLVKPIRGTGTTDSYSHSSVVTRGTSVFVPPAGQAKENKDALEGASSDDMPPPNEDFKESGPYVLYPTREDIHRIIMKKANLVFDIK